jgi:quinol monooxygenase YgiN
MMTIVAKLKVRSGKQDDAERALTDMIEYVRANEPGTVSYTLHRAVGDPTTLLMYEQYADQAAVDTHGTSARIQQLFATLGPLLDGQPSIEMYSEVAGKK